MIFPHEFVSYMAKKTLDRLVTDQLIEIDQPEYVTEVVTQLLLEELTMEDRINEEVRKILNERTGDMQRMGAAYDEMFKKVKNHLVRERNIVL